VRGVEGAAGDVLASVQFTLDPATYVPSVVTVTSAPFELSRVAPSASTVKLRLAFRGGREHEEAEHLLVLAPSGASTLITP
jgi:hypothetical protein